MVNFVPKRNTMYLSVTPFPTLRSFSPLHGYTLANVKPSSTLASWHVREIGLTLRVWSVSLILQNFTLIWNSFVFCVKLGKVWSLKSNKTDHLNLTLASCTSSLVYLVHSIKSLITKQYHSTYSSEDNLQIQWLLKSWHLWSEMRNWSFSSAISNHESCNRRY